MSDRTGLEIAIVGLAGRFPGAGSVEELWENLVRGVESISRLSDEELAAAGVPPSGLADPRYVKASPVLEGADLLDAEFFGFTPREAEIIDPQHRLFLECAWEALESAGYDPEVWRRPVGVYAGVSFSTYALLNVWASRGRMESLGGLLGADKDHFAPLVSWKLNLEGPSLAVQTACSTSLVAVHLAAQGLLNGECDMALAGGSSIRFPQRAGYVWQEGGIHSPDGHCRAFDAEARGTVFGNGLGVVALKRLEDALADGDTIHAVIKGSAINNDGAGRIGYTAPRLEGQVKVIRAAQIMAEVDPDTIGFVEAHGTGTPLGDPIEVAALTEAFRAAGAERKGYCALGSIKTNVGHLNAAAGVAGLIKAALALKHRTIPPTLHFQRPNPEIDFASSPFFVNAELLPWSGDGEPRRAAVSSFGMGGTNAHVILEEAPEPAPTTPSRSVQMLTLSARSAAVLEAATERLAAHLERHPEADLADIAYTLHVGRRGFGHRRTVLARSREEALAALAGRDPLRVLTAAGGDRERPVFFLFPGQGAQHASMARGLYETEPTFREEVDRCADLLKPRLGFDLREVLADGERLGRTAVTQPALFVIEHALARLWMSWGLRPQGMIGHSIGEYVAACLAGVFSLEDALALVALRGRLIDELPGGAMLAVPLSSERLEPLLGDRTSLAAVNGPAMCVVSGDREEIERLRQVVAPLLPEGLECRPLHTSHAFHSAAMEPILGTFTEAVRRIVLKAPSLPFVSNVTGRWITAGEATDPAYWARHLRGTVRFSEGLATLGAAAPDGVFLEVGPGRTLGTLARQHPVAAGRPVLASARHPQDEEADQEVLLRALGRLWLAGVPIDWPAFYAGERRRRLPLPTYPFERRRYWIEPRPLASPAAEEKSLDARPEPAPVVHHHPRPSLGTAYVAPESEAERVIAEVWRGLFGIAEVGVHDDFFDLGGHSLLITQMASRVRAALGLELPLRIFFEERTVARLAAALERERAAGRNLEAPPLVPVPRESELLLSFGQQRLWFLDRLEPGSTAYNMPAALRLLGHLDVVALKGALDEIVRRHEVLRTTFAEGAREPVQVIHNAAPLDLAVEDLSGLPLEEREAAVRRLVAEDVRRPFDLARGPLVRASLLRLGDEEHVLLFAMHHIVTDGWSMGVLVREVAALYRAFLAGEPSSLPELPVQYADYAAWQRSWLTGEVLEEHVAWWRQRLAGAPALLRLPTDHPRPAVQRFQGARVESRLPIEPSEALQAFGQRRGATLFMTVLAAFAALLQRHSGQDDLVVGTPTANRGRAELDGLIGFFVNTLVLRVGLAGDPRFADLVERVRESTLGAYAHQDLPFEKLVEELQPERSLAHSPVFQVMLALQNMPGAGLELPGLTLRAEERPQEISKFDLTLTINETAVGLFCVWRYNTELFDAATVERMVERFRILAEGIAANPEQPLSALPLLDGAERTQVLEWSRGEPAEPGRRLLHEMVAEQADRRPDAVAVVFEGAELTYGELDRRANRLARRLRRLGVGPETPVGLRAERSMEMVVGLLAVLKAGGAYVPMDPAYPAERLAWLAADCGASLLLTETELNLPEDPHDSAERLPSAAGPDNLAYVIYTSGSTGTPKGVLVTHRGLDNLAEAQGRLFGIDQDSRVLQFASLSFDASVSEIAMAFRAGAALVLASRSSLLPGPELIELLRDQRITKATLPPSALAALPEADLPDLRTIVVAGEACPVEVARRWGAGRRLVNAYGPTEATVCATAWVYDGGDRLPIGRPIPNVEVYVLEATGEPAPVRVPGELLVGGIGLARGYRNRPDLTAERFVPHPFATGERLYRTGDLVRFRGDGELEFLGRIDHQVKIRGVRVELGEVEAALMLQPGVREAVAVAREDGLGPARLIAYVTGEGLDGASLRDELSRSLPEPLVPSAVVALESLPLTPNGKVDRRALPAPETAVRDFVAPRTELERFLAGLYQEVLGVERVGIHDDFFALGGNSITGAMFVNRLQKELGEIVHVVVMFDAPTVAQLAEWVTKNRAGAQVPTRRVDEARVEEIRALIPPLPSLVAPVEKNPPAVFVLSPPRSGSTLLRVMLGGNPRLFAPPELELLSFDTLEERRAAFPGRNSFWLEGVTRAVMEIRRCTAEEAEALLADLERQGMTTTRELYRAMQEWIGGRILVDKTPSYALDLSVLRRAEETFENTKYIHLLRHPYGMIRSFEEAKLEQVFFRHPHSFQRRELAELIWLVCQRNIREFLAGIPEERRMRVRFEDVVAAPEKELRGICEFLEIEYHPDMAEPYKEKSARMTDGIHQWSRMLGDVKFHQHSGIDRAAADRWREMAREDFLGDVTWELAEDLGYPRERRQAIPPLVRTAREQAPPLSFGQLRLWFLDQLEPGGNAYNIPSALRLAGSLDIAALAGTLDEIVRRHEILRTTFAEGGKEPFQVIHPPRPLGLRMIDLSSLSQERREAEAKRLVAAEARRPFDLAVGPLARAALFRLGDEDHGLLLTLHHIVSDGWSVGVLVREVAALYATFREGRPSPLPELAVQYADYAAWQRDWLQGETLESQIAYWRGQLAAAPALELPTDRPRPPVQRFRGAARPFFLSRETSEALTALGQAEGATLFMTLAAAFQVLLHRYSGQDDILVGTPIAGRNRAEVEELIGFFVNTLVLRTNLAGGPGFPALLERVRREALEAFAHQELPFEKLVEELQPERDLSRSPLFQVMFSLQNASSARLDLPGLKLASWPLGDAVVAKFDLTLTMAERGDGLAGSLEYSTDLFERSTIERMLGHFRTLLNAIVTDPRRSVSELPLLTGAEREQLLVAWNATDREVPELCVHQGIAAQAARTPDAVAVVFGTEALTYGELDRRANALAHRLRAAGVGPETRVGIALERSLEMVVGLLAVLKAGGAYVPLDPSYPAERLDFMREDAGITLLLTAEAFAEVRESDQPPASGAGPLNLAYVIYTSGSTGRPKGVQISHAALANFLASMAERPGISAGDALLAVTSLSFDIAGLELYLPLLAGGQVTLASREEAADGRHLQELIASSGATVMQATPATWRLLLESGWTGGEGLKALCGGEPLPRALAASLRERVGSLWNVYGPTETTVWSTVEEVAEEGAVTIGRPIANTTVYILDAWGSPAPVSVPGELLLGGAGLARGYLGRPELTAERFIPDPFGTTGARLYRTGDLARYRPDGRLEHLGRIDHQVKVRGFRIELGEIEAALGRHPEVAAAVVTVREDVPGDARLAAYVIPRRADLAGDLRSWLRRTLPDYMIPTAWVTLAAFPLTPNGKVDRKALPKPEAAGEATVEPRTPAEELLAAIWCELLGLETLGVHDNFFDLGGHSLKATQLVARMRQAFGIELPLRRVFEAPTVEGQARWIQRLRSANVLEAPPIVPVPREGELPLSFSQQRVWVLDQLEVAGTAYHLGTAVRLRGRLDPIALEAALNEVVRRHESLRTVFASSRGNPYQIVLPALDLSIPRVDLRILPEGDREREARLVLARLGRVRFDLAGGPLLRAALVAVGAEEHLFAMTLHHIVSDAWSTGILVREVAALYRSFVAGLPSPLEPLPVQYPDFAAWQRSWLSGEVLDAQLGYWRERLAGLPPVLDLAPDKPRRAGRTAPLGRRRATVPVDLSEALRDLGRREQATPFMTLLGAFATLLGRYTGQPDIPVGTPIANRGRVELEGLIGFFANTLVLRTDLAGDPTFAGLLERVRTASLDAYAHQDLPFERLVEELQPERNLAVNPLFQVMFQMQNVPSGQIELPGLSLLPVESERGAAMFDLVLSVREHGGVFAGLFEYDADLFEAATAERLGAHWLSLLASIAADSGRPVSGLPLLSAAELQQVTVEWSDTETAFSHGARVPDLIAQQVKRTPEAIAVSFQGRHVTYRELDHLANQLAEDLSARGVGPEARVGVCLKRSPEMVAALLAVWKAGAAYVPMDPSYPEDRLAYMLDDAGIALLLADGATPAALRAGAAAVLRVDQREEGGYGSPRVAGDPENLAYVIYTSGSTGWPKGVEISHGALVSFLESMAGRPGLAADDTLLAVTSLSFDIAGLELFLPLLVGARIELASREDAADGARLLALLRESGATVMQATPVTWQMLVEAGWQGGESLKVLCGGEALPEKLAAELCRRSDSVWNLYGPTETTVWSAARRVRAGEKIVVGPPIANTGLYPLDAHLRPAPVGVPGELWIGGLGLARGYHGRPDLTAERFLPDPFAGRPGARMYRTGDLVRFRPDGALDFLGRADHQVKVRGFRIELGEIEAALEALPAIERAVVAARGEEGARRLVAWLVPRDKDASLAVADLRESLARTLPDYMVPSAWVVLDALPLTPNGKVDRKALPAPESSRPEPGAVLVAPRTALEELLAGIWAEVLRVERVGALDNFFVLGGHSLLATQVVSRVGEALEMEVPLRRLFEAPTVAGMAAELARSADPGELERSARLVLDLLQLSDEEVDGLLLGRDLEEVP